MLLLLFVCFTDCTTLINGILLLVEGLKNKSLKAFKKKITLDKKKKKSLKSEHIYTHREKLSIFIITSRSGLYTIWFCHSKYLEIMKKKDCNATPRECQRPSEGLHAFFQKISKKTGKWLGPQLGCGSHCSRLCNVWCRAVLDLESLIICVDTFHQTTVLRSCLGSNTQWGDDTSWSRKHVGCPAAHTLARHSRESAGISQKKRFKLVYAQRLKVKPYCLVGYAHCNFLPFSQHTVSWEAMGMWQQAWLHTR